MATRAPLKLPRFPLAIDPIRFLRLRSNAHSKMFPCFHSYTRKHGNISSYLNPPLKELQNAAQSLPDSRAEKHASTAFHA
jgi:hypothetical protein